MIVEAKENQFEEPPKIKRAPLIIDLHVRYDIELEEWIESWVKLTGISILVDMGTSHNRGKRVWRNIRGSKGVDFD